MRAPPPVSQFWASYAVGLVQTGPEVTGRIQRGTTQVDVGRMLPAGQVQHQHVAPGDTNVCSVRCLRACMCDMSERCVAHLDMDAFYVSVELRRRPELHGKPVIVAGSGPRAVVTTASYEARKFGVGSAIPASRARRLCPHGVFLPPDFPYYRAASAQVMTIIRRNVETVEVVGLDEVYLELTGLPAPKAGMRRIVAEIQEQTGLTASVGIGPNKLVAKVASDAEKPHGFVVLSREQACERFAASPCRLIPGIGGKTAERLQSLGIKSIAELAATPLESLGSAFSARTALHLQALAQLRARRRGYAGAQGRVRVAGADLRHRYHDARRARTDPGAARRRALLGAWAPGSSRAHGGHQGAPR